MRVVRVINKIYKGRNMSNTVCEITDRGLAHFHGWGSEAYEAESGFGTQTVAILEWQDGSVELVVPNLITFVDQYPILEVTKSSL